MVDLISNAPTVRSYDLAGDGREAFRAREADQGLWSGEEAREEREFGEVHNLGIGKDGGLAEDCEARERKSAFELYGREVALRFFMK